MPEPTPTQDRQTQGGSALELPTAARADDPRADQTASATARAPKPRDPTFDILKGLSILEVMTHHTLSTGMRKFANEYDPAWWAMATMSRILHFAVPAFLLVSAVLLARSVASKPSPNWRRFAQRRFQRTLWPYLVWSALYVAFRLQVVRVGSDIEPISWSVAGMGAITTPGLLSPERLWFCLVWGKSYFHIYFMVVLLQFSIVFPLLLATMRRIRLGFGGVVALSAVVQMLAFLSQRHIFTVAYPGSTVLWYCMPVATGMWIGLNWGEWDGVWRRWRWWIGAGTVAGLSTYLPLALAHYARRTIPGLPYNAGIAVYCLGVALMLLALSRTLAGAGRVGRVLQRIGDRSIALFLIHPIVLYLLSGPSITAVFRWMPAPTLALGLTMMSATWILSEASRRLRLDGILFGR